MKDRIAQIMEHEGMNAMLFAKETGIQQASISHILNGRNNPSLEIIKRIHQRFSYINLEWLLYGEGEMITSSNAPAETGENGINPSEGTGDDKYAKDFGGNEGGNRPETIVKETIKYIEKPERKIVEIRIFFDDGTYETLSPSK
jgi:transcriptional regulator with XRE-family HTH domain